MKVTAVWMMMLTVCLMTGCGKTEEAQAAAVAPAKADPTAGSGATDVAAAADAPSAMRYGQSLPFAILEGAERKRFVALAGQHRIQFDADPSAATDEPRRSQRKGGRDEDAV